MHNLGQDNPPPVPHLIPYPDCTHMIIKWNKIGEFTSDIAGGSRKWCSLFGRQAVSLKVKHKFTICPSYSTPKCLLKRNENIYPHKNSYVIYECYSSIIHNNQKVETTQMPVNWWLDKLDMVYPYNKMLFRNKKIWIHSITKMNPKIIKWKGAGCKTLHIVWFHLSTGKKRQIMDRKLIAGCLELGVGIMINWNKLQGVF